MSLFINICNRSNFRTKKYYFCLFLEKTKSSHKKSIQKTKNCFLYASAISPQLPLHQTSLFKKRNPIAQNFIILFLIIFCIPFLFYLMQCPIKLVSISATDFAYFASKMATRPSAKSYTTISLRPSPCSLFDSTVYPAPVKIPARKA